MQRSSSAVSSDELLFSSDALSVPEIVRAVSEPAQIHCNSTESSSLTGKWTEEEQSAFLLGLELHGKDWKSIASMIPTRTLIQTRTHAQKYFRKLKKQQNRIVITDEDVDLSESRWSLGNDEEDVFKDLDLETPADKRKKHMVGERRSRSPSVPSPDASGRRASDLLLKKKNRPIRSGRWTKGEEEYAHTLIKFFEEGLLPISDGMMLRVFLAKALNCDPMRISKKFAGNAAVGKQVFKRNDDKLALLSPEELVESRRELALYERRFLAESKQLEIASSSSSSFVKTESVIDADVAFLSTVAAPDDLDVSMFLDPSGFKAPTKALRQRNSLHLYDLGSADDDDAEAMEAIMSEWSDTAAAAAAAALPLTPPSSPLSYRPVIPVGQYIYKLNAETTTTTAAAAAAEEEEATTATATQTMTPTFDLNFTSALASPVFRSAITTNRRNDRKILERRNSQNIEDIGELQMSYDDGGSTGFIDQGEQDWGELSALLGSPTPSSGSFTRAKVQAGEEGELSALSISPTSSSTNFTSIKIESEAEEAWSILK